MPHGHGEPQRGRRRLAWALALAAAYMGAEIAGGLLTGSLALLADAGHMASDAAALGLALFAARVASRPGGPRFTFGRARAEPLAALVQGAALLGVAMGVAAEAVERLGAPPAVAGAGVMGVAAGGLAVNLAALWILDRGRHASLNVRGAWLHVLGDTLGSVGALGAGAAVWAFGWAWADPAASLGICALLLVSAVRLLREAAEVLMEAAPRGLDVVAIGDALAELPGVTGVHDLHVWSVGDGRVALSCHLVASEDTGVRDATPLLGRASALLRRRFAIAHAALQVEPAGAGRAPLLCAQHAAPDACTFTASESGALAEAHAGGLTAPDAGATSQLRT